MNSAQGRIDKFETLCYVKADLSTAPSTSKYTTTGRMSYRRDADVILLVGLTELKAQISWIDSRTVRPHLLQRVVRTYLTQLLRACATLEDGEKVRSTASEVSSPTLNLVFRSAAVVVYDNPSERT